MSWLFDEQKMQDAWKKAPTPDISVPPPTIDKDEPGLQDATVSDAAMIAPLSGLSKLAPEVEDASAFSKWFGDSKVVDAAGKPKTLYHGSTEDFNAFDPTKAGSDADDSLGHFMSEDPSVATQFAKYGIAPGSNIKPVSAAIRNPLTLNAADYQKMLLQDPETAKSQFAALKAQAIKAGHDGVYVPAAGKEIGLSEFESPTWVAFRPTQIKSATGNSGAFDAANPDITMAHGGEVMSKPIIKDSTLGDDQKGFQALANRKAMENGTTGKQPITTTSMQSALASLATPKQAFADGGTATNELMGGLQMPSGPVAMPPAQSPTPINPLISADFQTPAGPAAGLSPDSMEPDIDETGTPTDGAEQDPTPNPLQAASAALANTPDTNPNIYQGMTAADRLALQQQLMARMNSGGSLLAQGLGGIGDAVSNSFGGKNTHFQKDIMDNNQKAMDNQLSGVDTARAQKLQDIQGNQSAQLADPNSAMSQSMRKTLQSAGLKVPSGMSGEVMLKVAGPLGELAFKQASLGVQQATLNNTVANQQAERVLQATKEKAEIGVIGSAKDKIFNGGQMTKALDSEIAEGRKTAPDAPAHGVPDLGSTFNGQKVLGVKRIS